MRKTNVALWVVQGFLALFFALASGAPKLLLPPESLPMPIPIPTPYIQLIGMVEVLGALGLILPGVLRVRPNLTPLAAVGLVLLTVCAAIYQVMAKQPENAVFALGMGLLAALVAYGRWQWAPLGGATRRAVLSQAS